MTRLCSFVNEKVSIVCNLEHWHFEYQSCADGHLGLPFLSSATTNTQVPALLWCLDLESFGQILRSGIAGSYTRSNSSFLRTFYADKHKDWNNLHFCKGSLLSTSLILYLNLYFKNMYLDRVLNILD